MDMEGLVLDYMISNYTTTKFCTNSVNGISFSATVGFYLFQVFILPYLF